LIFYLIKSKSCAINYKIGMYVINLLIYGIIFMEKQRPLNQESSRERMKSVTFSDMR
jgi:hypothetical protein